MAGEEPSTEAPNSPTGGRGALAEALGNMWSALVLGLLAVIFAWFWFGGSDDGDNRGEAAVPGAAEPCTEPVESAVSAGDQRQQQAKLAESVPVSAEAESAEHLLNTKETSVCEAKTSHQIDQLDMGQKEKRHLCYENQKSRGNNTSTETSRTYPVDLELEVFPPAEVASDSPEHELDSLTVDTTPCGAQEALLVAIPTAEGTLANAQATVLDNTVLQSDQDVTDTLTRAEAESSTQDAMLAIHAVQYTLLEGEFSTPKNSIVHKAVSEESPAAIAAAPLLLHETAINTCMSAEDAQYILQKDELAVEAELFSGMKHDLAAEAAHGALQENVPVTKATYSVLQSEGLGAEAEHHIVLENGVTKEAAYNAHAHKLRTEGLHTIPQDDEAGHVLQEDGIDAVVSQTTIQEGGLDVEPKHITGHKDMLDSESPYSAVQENGPDAEVVHTIVRKGELDASETYTNLGESLLDVAADATYVRMQGKGLVAEAAQASIEDAVRDSSPAVEAIQNICAARKEQELFVHTISQKLGYINGQEVIDHFAGCHEIYTDELQMDSYATKEMDIFVHALHVDDDNSDHIYKSEPQPKHDSDSKMRKIAAVTPMPQYVIVKFRVHYITHSESQLIAVTGNNESLGEWNIYVPLKPDKDGFWSDFVLLPVDSSIEWKFVMVENGKIKRWEECNNRYLKTGHDDIEAHQWWGYP